MAKIRRQTWLSKQTTAKWWKKCKSWRMKSGFPLFHRFVSKLGSAAAGWCSPKAGILLKCCLFLFSTRWVLWLSVAMETFGAMSLLLEWKENAKFKNKVCKLNFCFLKGNQFFVWKITTPFERRSANDDRRPTKFGEAGVWLQRCDHLLVKNI